MDFSKTLSDCLDVARSASRDVEDLSADDDRMDVERLHWLETQLANVVAELDAMLADIESGLSIQCMGFSCEGDFEEMIEGFEVEIVSLRGQIRSLLLARQGRCV